MWWDNLENKNMFIKTCFKVCKLIRFNIPLHVTESKTVTVDRSVITWKSYRSWSLNFDSSWVYCSSTLRWSVANKACFSKNFGFGEKKYSTPAHRSSIGVRTLGQMIHLWASIHARPVIQHRVPEAIVQEGDPDLRLSCSSGDNSRW